MLNYIKHKWLFLLIVLILLLLNIWVWFFASTDDSVLWNIIRGALIISLASSIIFLFRRKKRKKSSSFPKENRKKALIYLGYSLLIVSIVTILVFFIGFHPEMQIPPSKELTLKDLIELRNEARRTNAQIIAGLVLLFGLYLTYRRITVTERNVQVAQVGQITERFTRAIEQLGKKQLEIRLGGIYALERIAKDSADDHWTIMEVLTTYVREKSPRILLIEPKEMPNDILAIISVIARRRWIDKEKYSINLSKTILQSVNLSGANLYKANFYEADLSGANIRHTNLDYAILEEANLSGADLTDSNLSNAYLIGSDFQNADLYGALLKDANLEKTNLDGANLQFVNLRGVYNIKIEQLQNVKSLWNAAMDDNLLKQVEEEFPHLLDES